MNTTNNKYSINSMILSITRYSSKCFLFDAVVVLFSRFRRPHSFLLQSSTLPSIPLTKYEHIFSQYNKSMYFRFKQRCRFVFQMQVEQSELRYWLCMQYYKIYLIVGIDLYTSAHILVPTTNDYCSI